MESSLIDAILWLCFRGGQAQMLDIELTLRRTLSTQVTVHPLLKPAIARWTRLL